MHHCCAGGFAPAALGELVLETLNLVGVKVIVWYNVLILVLTQILLRTISYCLLGETRRAIYLGCESFSG